MFEPPGPIETIDHVIELLRVCPRPGVPWWRGEPATCHGTAGGEHDGTPWQLEPKAFRPEFRHRGSALDVERRAIYVFERQARPRMPDYDGRADCVERLCLMQHYGIPTRLLDWSMSILAAVWFAVEPLHLRKEDASLWQLDAYGLAPLARQPVTYEDLSPTHPVVQVLAEYPFNPPRPGGRPRDGDPSPTAAFIPTETDWRMSVQQSAFTIHGEPGWLQHMPVKEPTLLRYTIPADAKPELRHWCEVFGVSRGTIFPDLAELGRQISDDFQFATEELAEVVSASKASRAAARKPREEQADDA